jgi:transposase-like protein
MPKPGPQTTNKYSAEFKATAVRLSQLPGVEVQDVASSLYIHPSMLSRWRKQAREGADRDEGRGSEQGDRSRAEGAAEGKEICFRKLSAAFRCLPVICDVGRHSFDNA